MLLNTPLTQALNALSKREAIFLGSENNSYTCKTLIKLTPGFHSLVGFRIPWAVFRIPKPRISHSTSNIFPDSGIWIPLHGVISVNAKIEVKFLTSTVETELTGKVWTPQLSNFVFEKGMVACMCGNSASGLGVEQIVITTEKSYRVTQAVVSKRSRVRTYWYEKEQPRTQASSRYPSYQRRLGTECDGELSRQAWQATSHPKSPRTTGNEAGKRVF